MIPNITLTGAAAGAIATATAMATAEAAAAAGDEAYVHVFVDSDWDHGLDVGPRAPGDLEVQSNGLTLLIAPALAAQLDGIVIDFVDTPDGSGFRIDNPNAPPAVKPMSVRELKARRDDGEPLVLLDVRTAHEVGIARLEGSRRFDVDDVGDLIDLDRSAMLVFICHHGIRSHAAARYFVQRGFRNVFNVLGGIDAWSVDVDPSVPRY